MYQTIHEQVSVACIFDQAHCIPKKFKWRDRVLPIEQITLQSEVKDGGVRYRWYSVMSQHNLYRLSYNRDSEQWWLEEVWCE